MNVRLFLIVVVFGLIAAGCAATDEHGAARKPAAQTPAGARAKPQEVAALPSHAQGSAAAAGHGHPHPHTTDVTGKVPAFETSPAALKSLPETLAPAQFTGKQRLGYEAVRAIPQTIAQLPCYCHCDEGFGHKSLHSCFVDDHAAHCAVCIDEALMAYKLEKEEKLKPEQIRQRIIAHYTAQN
jgi:Protein of unknown function with PCYCGC motif